MEKYLYYKEKDYTLYKGKMQDVLSSFEKESVDSIVCDPPYHLTSITERFGKKDSAEAKYGKDGSFQRLSRGFMGKEWDGGDTAFQPDTWKHCFDVLKPGGYLLAFGGSRTFHRIACAIEDAGFEIRDTIMWLYGMGFPKSQNIGKQLEKRLEDEKTKQKTEHDLRLMWERDIQKTIRNEEEQNEVLQSQLQKQSLQSSINSTSDVWREEPRLERWNNIQKTERELQRCKVCEMSKRVFINGEERWICNGTQTCDGKALREMFEQSGSCASYRPQSKQQQDRKLNAIQEQCRTQENREVIEYWNKFGTSLKPAFEPIIVARKPFKGSLVDNIIENGVGGINIDECRVGNEERTQFSGRSQSKSTIYNSFNQENAHYETVSGRFPANVILTYDETDFEEVCGGFPDTKGGGKIKEKGNFGFCFDNGKRDSKPMADGYDDSGSASRYFYCAKASKKDRDEGLDLFESKQLYYDDRRGNSFDIFVDGKPLNALRKNIHPTVKPVELMQYLVRLVTPKGGIIMDCFMGSGSTGKAVMFENRERNANYHFIGVEMTEEYLPICQSRIDYALNKYEYDLAKEIQKEKDENEKKGYVSLFDFED